MARLALGNAGGRRAGGARPLLGRPRFGGEVIGELAQIRQRDVRHYRRHDRALAVAALIVVQFLVEIIGLLAPDDRHGFRVDRHAIGAVARGAGLRLGLDIVGGHGWRGNGRRGNSPKNSDDAAQIQKQAIDHGRHLPYDFCLTIFIVGSSILRWRSGAQGAGQGADHVRMSAPHHRARRYFTSALPNASNNVRLIGLRLASCSACHCTPSAKPGASAMAMASMVSSSAMPSMTMRLPGSRMPWPCSELTRMVSAPSSFANTPPGVRRTSWRSAKMTSRSGWISPFGSRGMRWFMRPGSSRISGCSEPPNATFISWNPRQMPNSGTPRSTQASISSSAIASRPRS